MKSEKHSVEHDNRKVKEIKRRNTWSLLLFILLVVACFVIRHFQDHSEEASPAATENVQKVDDIGK